MYWILIVIAVIGYLLFRFDKKFKEKFGDKSAPPEWLEAAETTAEPVEKNVVPERADVVSVIEKNEFLSDEEKVFFKKLNEALENYWIFPKVKVADVIPAAKIHYSFDFIICTKPDMVPCAVIIYVSQYNVERQMLDNICSTAKLPLIYFKKDSDYSATDIREKIFSENIPRSVATISEKNNDFSEKHDEQTLPINNISTTETPLKNKHVNVIDESMIIKSCPKCASVMIKRRAKNGTYAGKLLWACSNYPGCRGVIAIDE